MNNPPSPQLPERQLLTPSEAPQQESLSEMVAAVGMPTKTLPEQYDSDCDGLHPAVTPDSLARLMERFEELREGRIEITKPAERALFLADCLEAVDENLREVGIPNVNRSKPIHNEQYILDETFQVPDSYMLDVEALTDRARSEASASEFISEGTMDQLEGQLLNSFLNLSLPHLTQTTVKERYIDSRMSAPFGKRYDTFFMSMHERRIPYSLTWAMLSSLSGVKVWQETFQRIENDLNDRMQAYLYHRARFHALANGESSIGFVDLGKRYPDMPIKAIFEMSGHERALGKLLVSRQAQGVDTLFAAIGCQSLQLRLSEILYVALAVEGALKKKEQRLYSRVPNL